MPNPIPLLLFVRVEQAIPGIRGHNMISAFSTGSRGRSTSAPLRSLCRGSPIAHDFWKATIDLQYDGALAMTWTSSAARVQEHHHHEQALLKDLGGGVTPLRNWDPQGGVRAGEMALR
jgi:hypothetical protein